jgi:hypothetical protein
LALARILPWGSGMKLRRSLTIPGLLLVALNSFACGGDDGSSGSSPATNGGSGGSAAAAGNGSGGKSATGNGVVGIRSFSSSDDVVEAGSEVTLSWQLDGEPDELLLDGKDVLGQSSLEVTPQRRQRFELVARYGAETFSVDVEIAARGIALLAGSERGAGNFDGDLDEARFRGPAAVTYDADGNLYVGDYSDCTVRKVDTEGNVTTIAGSPLACDGADGKGSDGHFRAVVDLAAAEDGTVYVADGYGKTIRRIAPDGMVTTLAGKDEQGDAVDGTGEQARFDFPASLELLPNGDLLVADSAAYAIRRVTPEGVVTTEYGVLGQQGSSDSPEQLLFKSPTAIVRNDAGNLYVADGCEIRKITPTGTVSHYVGNPLHECGHNYSSVTQTRLSYLYSIGVDGDGNVFFQDTASNQLLHVVDGYVEIFSGKESTYYDMPQDGTRSSAIVSMIWGMTTSPEGELVLAERYSDRVRKVDAQGNVRSFVGQATPVGDTDGPIGLSRLGLARDLLADANGNLLVVDAQQNSLRAIDANGTMTTVAGGNGVGWFDAAAPDALFDYPSGVVAGEDGNYFIVDASGVRELTSERMVETFAGTPGAEEPSDGEPGIGALGGGGKLVRAGDAYYLADSWGHSIRRIDADGSITTIAGAGFSDYLDGTGTDAAFYWPESIALLPDGDLVVADAGNYVLRRVTTDGKVTTLAGVAHEGGYADGPEGEGRLGYVSDLAVAPNGDVFMVDFSFHLIRKLSADGVLSTVAGTPGRSGIALGGLPGSLLAPQAIELSPDGDLFVGSGAAVLQITAP